MLIVDVDRDRKPQKVLDKFAVSYNVTTVEKSKKIRLLTINKAIEGSSYK